MASRNTKPSTTRAVVRNAVVPSKTYTSMASDNVRTHEGAKVYKVSALEQLRRSVLACMLWENTFYESGKTIVDRIAELVPQVDPQQVRFMAMEARTNMKLRHVPLLLAVEMLKHPEHKKLVRSTVSSIVQRPDEMGELLSLYWGDKSTPVRDNENQYRSQRKAKKVPMQLLRGIKDAFEKFNAYSLAKYQGKDKLVSLADVINLVHPVPKDAEVSEVIKKIVTGESIDQDTWEARLSAAGKEAKKPIFEDLLQRNKLGALALLRNLRGMTEVGVDESLIRSGLQNMNVERVLPYRFISARKYGPQFSDELEMAMYKCLKEESRLEGRTILLVDISGSMQEKISGKTEISRVQAAAGLAVLANALCEKAEVYLFESNTYKITPKGIKKVNSGRDRYGYGHGRSIESLPYDGEGGFKLVDLIVNSLTGGTDIAQAVDYINSNEKYDRIIMFTDEQSSTSPPAPKTRGYVINVANYQNGVGYGDWVHINGFSEATLAYIREYERYEEGLTVDIGHSDMK